MIRVPGMRPLAGLSWLIAAIFIVLVPRISSGARGEKRADLYSHEDTRSRNDTADDAEIRRIIGRYAKSVDEVDTTLASQVWLDSPDVSFIHPLGHEHGFEQIKENVYKRLMGGIFSERTLSIRDVSLHIYGDAAWAEFYWDFAAKLRKDGSPIKTHGRETQVYRKQPNGWRLVHVHYSAMPATDQRTGF